MQSECFVTLFKLEREWLTIALEREWSTNAQREILHNLEIFKISTCPDTLRVSLGCNIIMEAFSINLYSMLANLVP